MTPDQVRARAVEIARNVKATGAHYLTGTYGARPGQADPIVGRVLSLIVADLNWPTIAVYAAEFQGLRCCGRYAYVGSPSNRLNLGQTDEPPANHALARWLQSVRPVAAQAQSGRWDTQGSSYCGPALEQHPFGFGGGFFWPRRHCVRRRDERSRKVYLGESCRHKMHFDCVGFICYCFARARNYPMQIGLGVWPDRSVEIADGEAQPGDIALSSSHIALVVERAGTAIWLIHANGDSRGVERTRFARTPRTWMADATIRRVSASELRYRSGDNWRDPSLLVLPAREHWDPPS